MRIAILTRDARGEFGLLARALAGVLLRNGHEPVLELATDWIPAKFGGQTDRQVAIRMGCFDGFDHVFALGYRVALACAQAFTPSKTPWSACVLTSLPSDPPELPSLLGSAQQIYCPSALITEGLHRRGLKQAQTLVPPALKSEISSLDAKGLLGLAPDSPLAVSFGHTPTAEDRSALEYRVPDAMWKTDSELETHDLLHVIAAADLAVFGAPVPDFSYIALCALYAGVPILMPNGPSADLLIEPRLTGQSYGPRESMGDLVSGLLQLELLRETMRGSARLKVETEFDPEEFLGHFAQKFGQI